MNGPRLLARATAASPYAPGKPGAPTGLDLSGTALPPLDGALVAEALVAAAPGTARYPDTTGICELAGRHFGVPPGSVLVTAGSDDALERALRVSLDASRVALLTRPTFEMLPRFVRQTGARCREVAWPDEGFPIEELLGAISPDTGAVAVVSPNNPTGLVASLADLQRLARGAPHALLIVDQAYVEFGREDPLQALVQEPNVVCTRTFSKAWGMPGLRVGLALGPIEIIEAMRHVAPPFPVSGPAIVVAAAVLRAGDAAVRARTAELAERRTRLLAVLADAGLDPAASEASFVATASRRGPWLADALASLGVAVRRLDAHVRIAVPGNEPDFQRLATALRAVLEPEAILFDLDGVLADASRSYDAAIVATAASYGLTVTTADIGRRRAAGNANDDWALTHALIRDGGIATSLPEVTRRFEVHYQGDERTAGLCRLETLIPPRAWLRRLASRLPLGIVTGRPRADAQAFLGAQDLAGCFRTVVCREDAPLKPDPAGVRLALRRLGASRAWMIGDTPDDIRAAGAAGVVPLGVGAPGAEPGAPSLRAAGAARILTSLTDLTGLLP